jgi:hypothetical protein
MTVGVLSKMTVVVIHTTYFCYSSELFVIPAKAGIQEVFLSFNIREKNNIDSCLRISGITENENNKEKERKHWIPNQVGDDSGVVFGDDSLCGF